MCSFPFVKVGRTFRICIKETSNGGGQCKLFIDPSALQIQNILPFNVSTTLLQRERYNSAWRPPLFISDSSPAEIRFSRSYFPVFVLSICFVHFFQVVVQTVSSAIQPLSLSSLNIKRQFNYTFSNLQVLRVTNRSLEKSVWEPFSSLKKNFSLTDVNLSLNF